VAVLSRLKFSPRSFSLAQCTRHLTLPRPVTQAGKAGDDNLLLVAKLHPGSYTLRSNGITAPGDC
jgi:hypothetical protein